MTGQVRVDRLKWLNGVLALSILWLATWQVFAATAGVLVAKPDQSATVSRSGLAGKLHRADGEGLAAMASLSRHGCAAGADYDGSCPTDSGPCGHCVAVMPADFAIPFVPSNGLSFSTGGSFIEVIPDAELRPPHHLS
jgi:hypothetical protein